MSALLYNSFSTLFHILNMPRHQIPINRRFLFSIILLIVYWVYNLLKCIFSSEKDISITNIITIDSFIFTLIISIYFYFFNFTAGSDGNLNNGINLSKPVKVRINILNTAIIAMKLYFIISIATNSCSG